MTDQTVAAPPEETLAPVAQAILAEEAATRNPVIVSAGARIPAANLASPMSLNVSLVEKLKSISEKPNPLVVKPPVHVPPQPPPPPQPPKVANWNPITFSGGIPVGGWATVTIYPDGNWDFTGGFHDSGAPSFSDQIAFIFTGSDGSAFSFSHSGEMHGTFAPGSRDDNWNDSSNGTPNPALAHSFASLNAWHSSATTNWDLQDLLNELKAAAQVVGAVIAVVGQLAS